LSKENSGSLLIKNPIKNTPQMWAGYGPEHGRLCITMSANIWDNSHVEKAQLNKCDLSARLKAG